MGCVGEGCIFEWLLLMICWESLVLLMLCVIKMYGDVVVFFCLFFDNLKMVLRKVCVFCVSKVYLG